MDFLEIIRVIFLAIVQGITEWLPVSSTGHMILVEEFLNFSHSPEFWSVFLVVIQLASVLAVVTTFFKQLNPFGTTNSKLTVSNDKLQLWLKIGIASIPAALIGIFFDDLIPESPWIVAVALIFYGFVFIIIENLNRDKTPKTTVLEAISYKLAFVIGIFQAIAIVPGTSRSGATIIGGLMLGMSRKTIAEFTFFLAIPAMAGASLIRIMRFGLNFTGAEWITMIIGCTVAFVVSVITIKFLLGFIKKNDFKPFAYYRIALGIVVFAYFFFLN
jgi:undecaprenyl-diphosphatase